MFAENFRVYMPFFSSGCEKLGFASVYLNTKRISPQSPSALYIENVKKDNTIGLMLSCGEKRKWKVFNDTVPPENANTTVAIYLECESGKLKVNNTRVDLIKEEETQNWCRRRWSYASVDKRSAGGGSAVK